MNITTDYITKDEYDRDWEIKYQILEKKYFDDDGKEIGNMAEYDQDIEKLDYNYAKYVSQKIHEKMTQELASCQSALERREYDEYDKTFQELSKHWNNFNFPFHYKMNARSILEKV